ncbi:hypothetical protein A3742_04320 [Oleiphilus sp. HI0071]|nr:MULTISPECIES: hypothetical protein [unclassified Oleiphilus]KZY80561.1 hypothetical protein A3742_20615 [Oleiphilus sp. HI0071]KZY91304.1 hypothetical protein A3744_05510 [Oleiphilus sp. HI0073]KZZ40040.1 hypothetical protein A3758_24670 [Oleiphilus sp. HI0118]KZZ60225.1 hypothetical protein A3760_04915 [Oleiphilus sp. HI0122]KZZ79081.1 hypothetical protein A3767_17500 [Oleiphilus sp. HI0133]
MYKSFYSFLTFSALAIGMAVTSISVFAEDKKPSIEDMVEKPTGEAVTDLGLSQSKRAKVTEEQAIAQLKYMMVAAFKRNEPDLLERGSFKPMGMTLDPDGNFRAIRVDGQDEMPQEVALEALVKALQGLAANRTQWAVGIIYVTGRKLDDGTILRQIVVASEHIAGWARSWTYPYGVIDGEVKMGQPTEREMKPVYYQR